MFRKAFVGSGRHAIIPGIPDYRAIEQTLIRYALACDTRNWALLDEVFTTDITAIYGGEYRLQGRHNLTGMIRSLLDGCGPTQHLLGNFRIAIEGNTAQCACYVRAAHAGRDDKASLTYEVWAEYRDKLLLTAEGWRISERRMVVFNETGTREVLKG
ncbi:MAG TPA: nuclear transport factor 2 family protein [Pseudomonadales bacterium]|nr:nuclear transport factor 2 family protein [Pseudomonadales bacterium]